MENQEKDLKRFVIEYEDGTVREVKKGLPVHYGTRRG